MNLSPHFTLEEMIFSQEAARRGIPNLPPPEVVANLKQLCQLLETVRTLLGVPIFVSSGYRCPALNRAVKGAKNSQHLTGQAADMTAPGFGSPVTVASRLISTSQVIFDQLIYEGAWVHLSWAPEPRRQVFTAEFTKTGTVYHPGLFYTA